ncbi:MAG TPA: carbonic anhydrase [Thermosynechococcaceae cyanobacterium]
MTPRLTLTRRSLLQSSAIIFAGLFSRAMPTEAASGDRSLKLLLAGNQRYISNQLLHQHQTGARIQEVALSQRPIACILGCADSRVPPEIIFDQGLGDLFVVRVAGNGLNDAVLGSIEFAAIELGVPLVLVLGHERCGAVTAAVRQAQAFGHVSTLLQAIQPAIALVKDQPGDPIDNAVRANVRRVVAELQVSQSIVDLVQQDKLKVVGARYDLDKGAIELIA